VHLHFIKNTPFKAVVKHKQQRWNFCKEFMA